MSIRTESSPSIFHCNPQKVQWIPPIGKFSDLSLRAIRDHGFYFSTAPIERKIPITSQAIGTHRILRGFSNLVCRVTPGTHGSRTQHSTASKSPFIHNKYPTPINLTSEISEAKRTVTGYFLEEPLHSEGRETSRKQPTKGYKGFACKTSED
jgi:hypothetical protein